jgi:[ribosomal protein S18]-alanine N-acetyltransferase
MGYEPLMASSTQIRAFRLSDLRRILKIERAAFPQDPYSNDTFVELYEECRDLFLVAKCSGRILGYMVTCVSAGKAEIVSIAVDPRHQKRGIGAALMKQTLSRLEKRDVRSLGLMVRPSNTAAARFYRKFGFIRVGRVARYYDDGGDAIQMTKDLAKAGAPRVRHGASR